GVVAVAAIIAGAGQASAQEVDDYVGAYVGAHGEHIAIAPLNAGGQPMLLLSETRDDALRLLFPVAGDTFMTGATIADPGTPERRVVFTRDAGFVSGVVLSPFDGGAERSARRVDLDLVPITVQQDDARLDGTLYLPPQPR